MTELSLEATIKRATRSAENDLKEVISDLIAKCSSESLKTVDREINETRDLMKAIERQVKSVDRDCQKVLKRKLEEPAMDE